MNESAYNKIYQVCELLVSRRTPPPIFQLRVEECINVHEENGYAQCPIEHKIKLKNPENFNDNQRGLKVCCDNAFNKTCVIEGGNLIFKFKPLISMIKYQDEYCAECCNHLGKVTTDICCSNCQLRKFCSETCKMKAKLNWHDLECEFMKYLEQELILKPENKDQLEPTEIDVGFIDNIISILLTVFRLLIQLSKGDSCQIELVLNLSDHIEPFENWLNGSIEKTSEYNDLFEITKNKMGKLIVGFFEGNKLKFNEQLGREKFKVINEYGLYRVFFLIYINCTTMQDSYGDNIGLMFDPLFSMINHSCEPNATIIWGSKNEVLIKALNDINCADEIFINYSFNNLPIEMRQLSLKKSFFFQCECKMCKAEINLGDPMLPVDCDKCGYHMSGFRLCNFNEFKTNGSKSQARRVSFSKQCQNCDNEVQITKAFEMYRKVFSHIKYITKINDLSLLFDWIGDTETLSVMTEDTMSETVSLFKKASGVISVRSWPMGKLINLLRVFNKETNSGCLNIIRLTLIGVLIGEGSIETSKFKAREGNLFHEVCVASMSYLAKEYSTNREGIDVELFVLIGQSVVFMTMMGYEFMITKYYDECKKGTKVKVPIMEEIKLMGKDANHLIKKVKPEAFIRKTSDIEILRTMDAFAERMSIDIDMNFPPIEFLHSVEFGIEMERIKGALDKKKAYDSRGRFEWLNEII